MGLRAPPIAEFQKTNSSIISVAFDVVNRVGIQLSMALHACLGAGLQPKTETPSRTEVDVPSELKKRPSLRGIGHLLAPTQEMANSSSKELSEAANASPPFSPYCSRVPQDLPWRGAKPSLHRAWEGEKAWRRLYGRLSPSPNAAQMATFRLRILVAGELAGA